MRFFRTSTFKAFLSVLFLPQKSLAQFFWAVSSFSYSFFSSADACPALSLSHSIICLSLACVRACVDSVTLRAASSTLHVTKRVCARRLSAPATSLFACLSAKFPLFVVAAVLRLLIRICLFLVFASDYAPSRLGSVCLSFTLEDPVPLSFENRSLFLCPTMLLALNFHMAPSFLNMSLFCPPLLDEFLELAILPAPARFVAPSLLEGFCLHVSPTRTVAATVAPTVSCHVAEAPLRIISVRILALNLPVVRGRSAAAWDLGWSAQAFSVSSRTSALLLL